MWILFKFGEIQDNYPLSFTFSSYSFSTFLTMLWYRWRLKVIDSPSAAKKLETFKMEVSNEHNSRSGRKESAGWN